MNIRNIKLWVNIALLVFIPTAVFAMTSTNYRIDWDSINIGGIDNTTSTNFNLRDTVGEHGTGFSDSETYRIGAGYRIGDTQKPSLSINVGTQENDIRSSWTAFSDGGNTVTVSATSSFTVDDYIGVIENEGFSQVVAVGKISDISGDVITVDGWEGEPSSLSSSPSGSDDYVYRMNGSQATLGLQSITTESTSMTLTDIATNANNGYTVTIQGIDDLSTGVANILSVSDGEVTMGMEEYGIETVGTLGVDMGSDLSIPTTTTRTVQESTTYGANERVSVIYKLSISSITPSGNYQQTVLYRITGNF